ncbi:hypothetical protein QYE76_017825 [Lolium multiflorum]|uniref:Uncharacterized protein n=1 Tax=Lolium multiflorum TaxID=4521 RepID=A0AAD8UXC3_LOLMU|nr:hypothetical protein QYE76_017825 [Lolium multiflorum]
MEMAVVSMERLQGTSPPGGVRGERLCPPDLGPPMAAAHGVTKVSPSLRLRRPVQVLFRRRLCWSQASALRGSSTAQTSAFFPFQRKRCSAATTTPPSASYLPWRPLPLNLPLWRRTKARLQKEVKSFSSKLDGAVKIAAEARQEVDSLKEELGKLKEKLKEEEASRLVAEARAAEKDEVLRQSSLALLEAANIPVDALEKSSKQFSANGVSMALASHQLTWELTERCPGADALDDFPQDQAGKTLGQLIDAFAVDTKEVIEGDIEEMTKELPKEQDGQLVDLSAFKTSALTCNSPDSLR